MKIAAIALAGFLLIALVVWIAGRVKRRSQPEYGRGLRANMEEMHNSAPFKRRD